MNAFQARAFIEQVLSSPNVYLAQALVDANLTQLDATFFQVLQQMIQEADNQGQFGSSLFSPNMPGVMADYVINSHAQSEQRSQGLRMLYQYAAARHQQTNAAPQARPSSNQTTQLQVTCSGCGNSYPVMCPGFGMHMPGPSVVATPQGGACTLCGAPFTFVTCACGTVTTLNAPVSAPATSEYKEPYEPGQSAGEAPAQYHNPQFASYHDDNQPPVNSQPANDDNPFKELFGVLQNEFQKEKDKGDMDEARQSGLGSIMERLGDLLESDKPGQSLEEMTAGKGKLDALMAEMLTRVKKPTLAGPELPQESRAQRVFQLLQDRKAFIAAESMKTQKSGGETDVTMSLFVRLGRLTTAVHQTGGDEEKLLALETDQARQIVNEVRLFARRTQITLARPDWSRANVIQDPNLVFFSGPDETRKLLAGAAQKRELEVSPKSRTGVELDESRWQDLRAASLAVFDVSEGSPQVFYELGLALVLGTELLILARQDANVPFDVAQQVHTYTNAVELNEYLSLHLEESLYGMQSVGSEGSSVVSTVAYAERLAAAVGDTGLTHVALDSLRKVISDPIGVAPALQLLNSYLQDRAQIILYPRWPGGYPDPNNPRCFVVMPFRKKLDPAYRLIEELCKKAQPEVTPIRGDVAEEGEIIRSIWEEIGRATHITIDLTDFNPNVCLELGIANALGRNVILIGREGTDKQLKKKLPNVATRRCHVYPANPSSKPQFVKELTRFLSKTVGV